MSRLYEITGNLLTLQEMLECSDNTTEDEVAINDALQYVTNEYEDKLDSYCKILKNLEADVDALKAEATRLSDRRKKLEANIDRLKQAMFDSMKATNTPKVKGTLFTVAIQRNGGKIPVIVAPDADTSNLPDQLVVVTEKPNLDAIREVLEAGKVVEGFTLGERGESLRIK